MPTATVTRGRAYYASRSFSGFFMTSAAALLIVGMFIPALFTIMFVAALVSLIVAAVSFSMVPSRTVQVAPSHGRHPRASVVQPLAGHTQQVTQANNQGRPIGQHNNAAYQRGTLWEHRANAPRAPSASVVHHRNRSGRP